MRQILIFGAGEMARLLHFYFSREESTKVVAFTVDKEYISEESFCGLDVVDFDDALARFPPHKYEVFVAIGPSKMNSIRQEKVLEVKRRGYNLASYISPSAVCESPLGPNSLVADFAVVNPFVKLGENNFIFESAVVSNESVVGNNCYISPRATVGTFSRVGDNSFLGTASVVNTRVRLGKFSLIGATCYISSNTEEHSVFGEKQSPYLGNISKKIDVSS